MLSEVYKGRRHWAGSAAGEEITKLSMKLSWTQSIKNERCDAAQGSYGEGLWLAQWDDATWIEWG